MRTGCWWFGFTMLAFAVAHTWSPDFWSNQNQYLLHAAARSGYGDLTHDWLANTVDPTPIFSAAVSGPGLSPGKVSVLFVLLLVAYAALLLRLLDYLFGPARPWRWLTAGLLVVSHAAILRYGSVVLLGKDYPWFLQAGVAGQYLLGPGLQPSVFGILLLFVPVAFADPRVHAGVVVAVVFAALAAVVHSTYLLPAGLLVFAFQVQLWREGQRRLAGVFGLVALAIVAPIIVYLWTQFRPTDAETFAEAQRLLVDVRIPHHCRIERWLDGIAVAQVAIMFAGWWVIRRSRLGLPLAVAATLAMLLSLIQWLSGNRTLALLFPWRLSAILMPLATAVLLDRLAATVSRLAPANTTHVLAIALMGVGLAGGFWIRAAGIGYAVNHEEDQILDFIRANRSPGDVYLLPVRIPPLQQAQRGQQSSTFLPPPRPKPGSNLIPVDFQRFRLATGAAAYVDFKSIPYKDVEVLEWHRRLKLVERYYDRGNWPTLADELRREGISHVIRPRSERSDWPPIHRDEWYEVVPVPAAVP